MFFPLFARHLPDLGETASLGLVEPPETGTHLPRKMGSPTFGVPKEKARKINDYS